MKTRTNKSYSSLGEIINALSKHPHANSVWVGENYSKADLIEDLKLLRFKFQTDILQAQLHSRSLSETFD